MINQNSQKVSIFSKISIKFNQFCGKTKKKYNNNADFKTAVDMSGDIILTGFLLLMTYLSLINPSLIIKLIGFGSGFWLIKEKIVPMIVQILNAFRLSVNYK